MGEASPRTAAVGRGRVAILATHPIQHFVPQYASLARLEGIDVRVYFESDRGLAAQYDPGFDRLIAWEDLNLDRFDHVFLSAERESSVRSLPSELEDFDPDALLVYGYASGIARRGARWARQNRKALVYCSDSELRQQRNRLREALLYAVKRRMLSSPGFFMTVGDANEDHYRHFGVNPSKFIRTGFPIDVERYRKALECRDELRRVERRRLGLDDDDVALLVVGKLQDFKRQSDVIDAVALLNKKASPRYVAVIAGSGPHETAVKAVAASVADRSVRLLGFVPHTELPAVYAAADIYVHPSERERHSLAISEAVFMGLPAIISDMCGSWGPTDDVQMGVNGLVFPVGDVGQLARCVEAVAEVDGVRDQYGAASQVIGTRHQRRAHGEAWMELLARLDQ